MNATLLNLPSRRIKTLTIAGAATSLLLGCSSSPDRDCRLDDAPPCDASTGDGSARRYIPYIASRYQRAFAPEGGSYLNDHTLARGSDGVWHLYGITHTSGAAPQEEREFLHATAVSLQGPWTQLMPILTARPDLQEQVLWAPHVVESGPGTWAMIYWAGSTVELPQRGLRWADSTDLRMWSRREASSRPEDRPPGGRDPFLFWYDGRWLLYSVWQSESQNGLANGQIIVSVNSDLVDSSGWIEPKVVLQDSRLDVPWGNTESPFVVQYEGQFYLFVTRTGRDSHSDYVRTLVFRSDDPFHFDWEPITTLWAHAAEIVVSEGEYYITSAGWTDEVGEINRGLSIALLKWAPQP